MYIVYVTTPDYLYHLFSSITGRCELHICTFNIRWRAVKLHHIVVCQYHEISINFDRPIVLRNWQIWIRTSARATLDS
jgi:hypothetical protein